MSFPTPGDATPYTDKELREFATAVLKQHDPANQDHNYERCEHCHYTRHPCDSYELAEAVLTLLERVT